MGDTYTGPFSVVVQILDELGRALFGPISGELMAKIEEVRAQVLGLKTDTDAMQGRVLAGVADLKAQIQALKDQLAASGDVPQDITDTIAGIDATVNALDPTKPDVLPPAPTPTPEPPPGPTPA